MQEIMGESDLLQLQITRLLIEFKNMLQNADRMSRGIISQSYCVLFEGSQGTKAPYTAKWGKLLNLGIAREDWQTICSYFSSSSFKFLKLYCITPSKRDI